MINQETLNTWYEEGQKKKETNINFSKLPKPRKLTLKRAIMDFLLYGKGE